MTFFKLVARNLLRHPLRTLLTVGSLVIALFLLCTLRSLVTTLEAGVDAASSRRIIVQSAVSLFVDLPLSYETKIAATEGAELVSKWHWFGAYYQEEQNQFGQFACTPETMLDMYAEDAISLPNYSPRMEGKAAFREHHTQMSKAGIKIVSLTSGLAVVVMTVLLGRRVFAGQPAAGVKTLLVLFFISVNTSLAIWSQGGLETAFFATLILGAVLRFEIDGSTIAA